MSPLRGFDGKLGHDIQGLEPLATRPGPQGHSSATARSTGIQRTTLIMADEILLNEAAFAVWYQVHKAGTDGIELGDVVTKTNVNQAQVSATSTEAKSGGFFDIEEREREQIIHSEEMRELVDQRKLPEVQAANYLTEQENEISLPKFIEWAKISNIAVNEVFKWGSNRGWIERAKGKSGPVVRLTEMGQKAVGEKFRDDDIKALEMSLTFSRESKPLFLDQFDGPKQPRIRSLLANRPELGKIKKRTERIVKITGKGAEAFRTRVKQITEKNALTPEDIENGAWKDPNFKLRPFDVTLAARDVYPAKIHPLRKIIEQTRRAFLEMGFAEVVSPMVESAFWNFDALFQPQDHPAREMQDTFYMRHPSEVALPDAKIVEPVKRTHEDGWETGSEGWGYTWSPERSKQVVLRTHTTAATIRALAKNPNPPGKFFCVGWTYRNETISFKHLPVFHQVDGIIIDEEANLASLMGTLQEFYSKMGFGRVKFKPAFYPYTEPSVDVVVYMESRGKWLEMGGAGIFRPEVTLPLGCKHPVLAWGLGIERLAMLRFGLSDIRELYRPSLDALEGVPLCR
jgi:phenylalanyl-tRNA synthetase alpha chain